MLPGAWHCRWLGSAFVLWVLWDTRTWNCPLHVSTMSPWHGASPHGTVPRLRQARGSVAGSVVLLCFEALRDEIALCMSLLCLLGMVPHPMAQCQGMMLCPAFWQHAYCGHERSFVVLGVFINKSIKPDLFIGGGQWGNSFSYVPHLCKHIANITSKYISALGGRQKTVEKDSRKQAVEKRQQDKRQ